MRATTALPSITSVTTTDAPAAASPSQNDAPMPRAPPVTIATLLLNLPMPSSPSRALPLLSPWSRVVCLGERQHRRDAGVALVKQRGPFVAGAAPEHGSEGFRNLRPVRPIVARRQPALQAELVEQLAIELLLQRADRHEFSVRGLIGPVERRPAVEAVGAALRRPPALSEQRIKDRR